MKARENSIVPEILKDKVIQRLTDDNDILYEITTIIRKFLRSTWLIEPNCFLFSDLRDQNLIEPMSQLLASRLNLGLKLTKEHFKDICWHMAKPFLNTKFTEILIGKIILTMDKSFALKEMHLGQFVNKEVNSLQYANFLIETTGETLDVLTKLKYLSVSNFKKTLKDLIDKRREHIKDYYHFELDNEIFSANQCMVRSYANKLCWRDWNKSLYWYYRRFDLMFSFFAAVLIVSPVFYVFNAELSLQNAGLIFLISIAISIAVSGIKIYAIDLIKKGRPLYPEIARFSEHYLMNLIIIKELLEQINSPYPQENTEILINSDRLQANKNPQKRLATLNSISGISDELDFTQEAYPKAGHKKIINQDKKNSAEKISAKIEEVNKQLVAHDNSQNSNKEIIWTIKKNDNEFVEIIYRHLPDLFKIIELWTLDPSKQKSNDRHYVIWNEEKIKNYIGKKNEQLYPDFFRIGQIGRIAKSENEQGYLNCESYENYSWKVKTLGKESKAFRLFFSSISTVSANSEKNKSHSNSQADSEKLTLYDVADFRKTH